MDLAASSLAGVITAIALVITAASGIIVSLTKFLPEVRKMRKAAEATQAVVDDVHTIVNQQRTDGLNFQRALIRALTDAGIPVPIDQSVQEPPASTVAPPAV